jgi:acyl-CoA synthetase (NDP forming)
MAESQGLTVPVLSESTNTALRGLLPTAAAVGNPVDLLASASADQYKSALELLLADPVVDSVLAIFVPPIVTDPTAVATAIASAARLSTGKPVATVFMRAADAPPELAAFPCFRFPEAAALAIARATAYGEWRRRPRSLPTTTMTVDRPRVRAIVDRALERGGGWLGPGDAEAVLESCGIRGLPAATVTTEEDAAERARSIGFPVAIKAVGPYLQHKTDVGGVHLGLTTEAAVIDACRDLRGRLGDKLTGLLVQRMADPSVELLVGLIDDDTFGPVVVCGPGGTMVELLGPPAARLLPLTDTDVDDLLRDMPGRALLDGYRGAPAADQAALRRLLQQVSALADCCPEILELDLNPVRLHAEGLSVLDVRIRIGRPSVPTGSRRIAY